MAPLLVGTDEGLHLIEESGRSSGWLEGRKVHALAADLDGWWALVDESELWWASSAGDWRPMATFGEDRLNCVLLSTAGLLVGAGQARLLRLDGDRLAEVESFQQADGRDTWYTPWGGPADVRSLSEGSDGTIYANVHVGGVVRSRDGGSTWEPTLDIDADVHQVLAPAGQGSMVLAASAWGLGGSDDGGDSWSFEDEGLHGSYLRSVAMSDATLFVGASEGHMGRRSAVYRRSGAVDSFARCANGLPGWFGSNIDTACLVARVLEVAFATEDGSIYWSEDDGVTWAELVTGLPPVRCVALV
jgi:hypothetical protein